MCGFIGLAGCKADKTIVLTTGLSDEEVFKIDSAVCTKTEVLVYMTNIQNSYEAVYGEEIWSTDTSGVSIQDSVKETVLARISKVKVLTLLAKKQGVALTGEEIAKTKAAAKEYYASLNNTEIEYLGVDEDILASMYQDYALAEKVYTYLIQDVNPEISDDDARTVTVSYILIKTNHVDLNGKVTQYSDASVADARQRAEQICSRINNGDDFSSLILEYNEDNKSQCSIRKGEMDPNFENATFNLGKDEVSGVVETAEGFYIIKVLNAYDREETDSNKQEMIKQMREEAFQNVYESFLSNLTGNLNEEVWSSLTFSEDSSITTSEFFSDYEHYFFRGEE